MKFGAVFPTTEIGSDPAAIRDWVQAAEQLGYSHVITYDHVLGATHEGRDPRLEGPYTEKDPFHEPFVLYGFMAAVTSTIELGTGVIILPQRQTVLVAKQAAQVDLLSGGRMRLGVGTGWNHVEYEALGESYADRGKRFSEQIEVLRRLWSEPLVDFSGSYHRIDRAGLSPLPRQIPIWFGGFSEPALKRAARLGDGFQFGTIPSRMLSMLARFDELLEEKGRSGEAIGKEAVIDISDGPEAWPREIEAWKQAGGTHLSLRAMDTAAELVGARRMGFQGPADYIAALESFRSAVGDDW